MNDTIKEKFEEYKKNTCNECLTECENQRHADLCYNKEDFNAGHDSRNHEVDVLQRDCKNLIEINNNQSKILDGLEAENKKIRERVKLAYGLISSDKNRISCNPWNTGMAIFREIIKE